MGFLTVKSKALSWEESKEVQDQVKLYGVLQAINLWNKYKDLNKKMDDLKWGEEVEYNVGTLSHKDSTAKIHLEGFQKVAEALQDITQDEFNYQEEFGSWMVEAVPNKPYRIYDVNGPVNALSSLVRRRQLINDEIFMNGLFITSLSSFPNLGTKNSFFSEKEELLNIENYVEHNVSSKSNYILDEMTNPHPRFPAMVANNRNRRGKNVDIRVPLYPDVNTGIGKMDGEITPGEIHMDAQHFGMGC
jgi:glutamate--cysteine ligase catalytic subunit